MTPISGIDLLDITKNHRANGYYHPRFDAYNFTKIQDARFIAGKIFFVLSCPILDIKLYPPLKQSPPYCVMITIKDLTGRSMSITLPAQVYEKDVLVYRTDLFEAMNKLRIPTVRSDKTVSGVFRLWRIWSHRDGFLYPLVHRSEGFWKKNPEGFVRSHIPPTRGTSQGFYGFYDVKELTVQEPTVISLARKGLASIHVPEFTYVLGSFLAWGKVVRATKGCRVEFAKPEYLILPDKNDDYALELMTVAEEYGMKPITAEQAKTLKGGLIKSHWDVTKRPLRQQEGS